MDAERRLHGHGHECDGNGQDIHDIDCFVNQYEKSNGDATKAEDWIKARGTAIVTDGTTDKKAGIHWDLLESKQTNAPFPVDRKRCICLRSAPFPGGRQIS